MKDEVILEVLAVGVGVGVFYYISVSLVCGEWHLAR